MFCVQGAGLKWGVFCVLAPLIWLSADEIKASLAGRSTWEALQYFDSLCWRGEKVMICRASLEEGLSLGDWLYLCCGLDPPELEVYRGAVEKEWAGSKSLGILRFLSTSGSSMRELTGQPWGCHCLWGPWVFSSRFGGGQSAVLGLGRTARIGVSLRGTWWGCDVMWLRGSCWWTARKPAIKLFKESMSCQCICCGFPKLRLCSLSSTWDCLVCSSSKATYELEMLTVFRQAEFLGTVLLWFPRVFWPVPCTARMAYPQTLQWLAGLEVLVIAATEEVVRALGSVLHELQFVCRRW